jgi:hypothetical protein
MIAIVRDCITTLCCIKPNDLIILSPKVHCPSKPNADDPSSGSHHAANRIYHCLFYVNSFDAALPGKNSEFVTYSNQIYFVTFMYLTVDTSFIFTKK